MARALREITQQQAIEREGTAPGDRGEVPYHPEWVAEDLGAAYLPGVLSFTHNTALNEFFDMIGMIRRRAATLCISLACGSPNLL